MRDLFWVLCFVSDSSLLRTDESRRRKREEDLQAMQDKGYQRIKLAEMETLEKWRLARYRWAQVSYVQAKSSDSQ